MAGAGATLDTNSTPLDISGLENLPAPARAILEFKRSCWSFMSRAVYTLDQADQAQPTKKYPDESTSKGPYLKYLVNKIQTTKLLATVKNRRLVVSWTGCGVILWDAIFNEGRFNAIISKKEEDSDELVRRCKFIYDNIPKDIMPFKPDMLVRYANLRFPEIQSEIKGLAQGPDQLRQYTCSRVMGDEVGFWPMARQTFVALKPTLEGGGQVFLVSTRFPGFFKHLIEDTLDD